MVSVYSYISIKVCHLRGPASYFTLNCALDWMPKYKWQHGAHSFIIPPNIHTPPFICLPTHTPLVFLAACVSMEITSFFFMLRKWLHTFCWPSAGFAQMRTIKYPCKRGRISLDLLCYFDNIKPSFCRNSCDSCRLLNVPGNAFKWVLPSIFIKFEKLLCEKAFS